MFFPNCKIQIYASIKVQSKYNSILNLLLNEKILEWPFSLPSTRRLAISCFIVFFFCYRWKSRIPRKTIFVIKMSPILNCIHLCCVFFLKIVTHAEIQRFKWFYKGKRKYRTKFRFFCSPNLFYADKFLWSRSFTAKSIKKF